MSDIHLLCPSCMARDTDHGFNVRGQSCLCGWRRDQPPCDRCGERKPVECISGDGWDLWLCDYCANARRIHDR